jgi:hypothetical protein
MENKTIKQKENIEDIYPMSDIEVGLVYHSLKDAANNTFYGQTYFIFKDPGFTPEKVDRTMLLMVEKHPILRTGFDMYTFKEPVQIVYKKIKPDISHFNISYLARHEQEEYINTILSNEKKIPFDFRNAQPLWRIRTFVLDSENICLAWINHHAMLDGWSFACFITELNNLYLQLKSDPDFVPKKLKSTYKQYVIEQIKEKRNRETIEYWKRELEGFKKLDFPRLKAPASGKYEVKTYKNNLEYKWLEDINHTAKKYNASLTSLCLGAYIYMLHMYLSENDMCVGYVSNNRPLCDDGDKILGCFVNEIPIRIKIPANTGIKWSDYIHLIHNKFIEVKKYERLSFFEIAKITDKKTRDKNPVFDTVFIVMDFHVTRQMETGLNTDDDIDNMYSIQASGNVDSDFVFGITMDEDSLGLDLSYSNKILNEEIIEILCSCFLNILHKFAYEPETCINDAEILTDTSQKVLLQFADAKANLDDIDFKF